MYVKMAVKNVKKSFKDYAIYFMTLMLAVCIFYSFNSIESQKVLQEVTSSGKEFVSTITTIISLVSVFVAVILGCLILYANNFLIKKRNRELGIYMTLGMSKSKISRILILETVIVGVFALITGLVLGLIASQALSVLTAKLFEFGMDKYSFVISGKAAVKTVIYFGVMFLLVMIFNTYVISKYKIIDLLTAGRKNEETKIKNPVTYLLTFILCVISLSSAYKMILEVRLNSIKDPKLPLSIVLGHIGTVLFFFSLTGFILYIVKKNKKIYFKGLNIFTVKQINSKVNTNFISMSVICIMMFITICVLSTGFSIKKALESTLKDATPYDFSGIMYDDISKKSVEKSFKMMDVKFHEDDKVVYYKEYRSDMLISDIIKLKEENKNDHAVFLKLSDYNKIMALDNKKPVSLKDNEVIISSNFAKIKPDLEKYMKNNSTIKIDNKTYNIKNKQVVEHNLRTDYMKNNLFTIIINDDYCKNITPSASIVNVNFGGNSSERVKSLIKTVTSYGVTDKDYEKTGYVILSSRDDIYEGNKGIIIIVLFVGIYLGIIFLISSMAVLALQQLSEASDSAERFVSLRRIGADIKSINKSIFTQTLIYFTVPVALALVHSVVGIMVISDFVSFYNRPDIAGTSMITAGIFLVIYMIYFYTTYSGYKNIIKSKIR